LSASTYHSSLDSIFTFVLEVSSDRLDAFIHRESETLKIFKAIAEIGGLFTIIFGIIRIPYKNYMIHKYYETIMNENYIFEFG